MRILIVEPEADLLLLLSDIFSQNGYDVIAASNGDQGRRYHKSYGCDLVIASFTLHGDMLKFWWYLHDHFDEQKVICTSVFIVNPTMYDRYFPKPVDLTALFSAVEELLDNS